MQILPWIKSDLAERKLVANYRELTANNFILSHNFGSNDYLALSTHPDVVTAFNDTSRVGSCSSRLAGGGSEDNLLLEQELAEYFEFESALLFSSGFLANLGLISSLVRREDVVFSDKLIHASLIEGIRLSGAEHFRFKHNDIAHLEDFLKSKSLKRIEGQNFFIVVESLYSMNGDSPDLEAISALSKKYNCILIVDEAHAIGVFKNGLSNQIDKDNLIITATFSKALGTYGGMVCGPKWLKEFLTNTSRALIYNTALPNSIVKATRKSLQIISNETTLGSELLSRSKTFRENLTVPTLGSAQIVSLEFETSNEVVEVSKKIKAAGYFVPAIRPPTVQKALLRISLSLHHSQENLAQLSTLLKGIL